MVATISCAALAACTQAADGELSVGHPDATFAPDATPASRDALIVITDAAPPDAEVDGDAGVPSDAGAPSDAGVPSDAGPLGGWPALRTCAPVEVPPAPPTRSWYRPSTHADGFGAAMARAREPHAAIEGHGDTVVAWVEDDWNARGRMRRVVRRSGVWGAAEAFGTQTGAYVLGRPRVALDDCGDGLIAWVGGERAAVGDPVRMRVYLSQLRDGVWIDPAGPEDAVSRPGTEARDPEVAINRRGEAIVAWIEYSAFTSHVWFREHREGRWSEPQQVDPADAYAQSPAVALGEDGTAIITWQAWASDPSCPMCSQLFLSERQDGVWHHPRDLEDHIFPMPGNLMGAGRVVIAPSGDAVIVSSGAGPDNATHVYRSERSAGVWHHPAAVDDFLDPPSGSAFIGDVTVGAGGDFAMTWTEWEPEGSPAQLDLAERRAGAWNLPVTEANRASLPGEVGPASSVAMDAYGDTTIVYTERDPDGTCGVPVVCERVLKSERRGGLWYHATSLQDAIGLDGRAEWSVRVVASAPGEQVIVWIESNGLVCGGGPSDPCLQVYVAEWR